MFNAAFYVRTSETRILSYVLRDVDPEKIEYMMQKLPDMGVLVAFSPVVPDVSLIHPDCLVVTRVL